MLQNPPVADLGLLYCSGSLICTRAFIPSPPLSLLVLGPVLPCPCLQWGTLFISSMKRAGVDVSQVVVKPGPTGRACILSCGGQRTMVGCGGSGRVVAGCLPVSTAALN